MPVRRAPLSSTIFEYDLGNTITKLAITYLFVLQINCKPNTKWFIQIF